MFQSISSSDITPNNFEVVFKRVDTKKVIETDYESELHFIKPTEFNFFKYKIRELILFYADEDRTECRKRLYALITPETDPIVKRELLYLLRKIRLEYNKESLQVYLDL